MIRLLVLISICVFTFACTDNRKPKNKTEEQIYHAADKMTEAYLQKDWVTFSHYIHPKMIARLGGDTVFQNMLATQSKEVPDSAIKSLKIGKVLQVVETPEDIQCVVEQQMLMQLQGMAISSTTYLVGESTDHGKNWIFFDASNSGRLQPTDIKPNLSPRLTIPAKKQQVDGEPR